MQLTAKAVQICKDSKTKKEKTETETNAFRGVLANLVWKTFCSLLQRLSKFARTQTKRKKGKKTETNAFRGVLANLVCKDSKKKRKKKRKKRKEKDRDKLLQGSSCKFGL